MLFNVGKLTVSSISAQLIAESFTHVDLHQLCTKQLMKKWYCYKVACNDFVYMNILFLLFRYFKGP